MKIIIFVLLATTAVQCQDIGSYHQQQNVFTRQPTLEPAPARLEPIRRSSYSISHGDAKSSVNVNLPIYHQPESINLGTEDSFQFPPQQGYLQQALQQYQAQVPKQSYLNDLATKQYLGINPNNAKPDIISQEQTQPQPQQQLYNVGYSINIANSPKLDYRNPMPPSAHSYRQQKLLNAEVITGTHKAAVEKPHNYDFVASNSQHSPNYISPNFPEKQSLTKVYSDVKNTHGYTWKNLSPGVEISGYHSLGNGRSNEQARPQSFDHAGALGKSQGFDISNVVENGKTPYQPQAYNINKALTEASSTKIHDVQPPDIQEKDSSNTGASNSNSYSHGLDMSSGDLKSYEDFGSQIKSGEFSFSNGPHKHSNLGIEIDKSLFDGFYKNFKPLVYQPEITLPSPNIPKNIHINLHGSASHQLPSYFDSPEGFKSGESTQSYPELQMINQHYAFAQASTADQYPQVQVSDDVKPVNEQQEENVEQQNQGPYGQLNYGQQSYGQQQIQDSYGQQSQASYAQQNQDSYAQQSQDSYAQQSQDNYAQKNQDSYAQQSQASYAQQNQDSYGQQSQASYAQQNQGSYGQHSQQQQIQQVPLISKPSHFKEQKGKEKKYNPQSGPVRQYGRPVVHGNEKNYRVKTALRPPPMIIIHQKY